MTQISSGVFQRLFCRGKAEVLGEKLAPKPLRPARITRVRSGIEVGLPWCQLSALATYDSLTYKNYVLKVTETVNLGLKNLDASHTDVTTLAQANKLTN